MAKVLVSGTTVVTFTDAAGTVRNMSAYIESMSAVGKTIADIDVTAISDTAERFIAGVELSPEITVSGAYEQTGTIGPDPVFVNLVGSLSTMVFNPVGTVTGSRRYTYQVLGRSFEPAVAIKERVNYTFMLRKDGTVTVGTVP